MTKTFPSHSLYKILNPKFVNHIFFILLCLSTSCLAFVPIEIPLDDFSKQTNATPNSCVKKGDTYKCIGYNDIKGAIFNTRTHHYYAFLNKYFVEHFIDYHCEKFLVSIDENNTEKITCNEVKPIREIVCIPLSNLSNTIQYDELGIVISEKINKKAPAALCRDSFHHQYGNSEGKHYKSKNAPSPNASQPKN